MKYFQCSTRRANGKIVKEYQNTRPPKKSQPLKPLGQQGLSGSHLEVHKLLHHLCSTDSALTVQSGCTCIRSAFV